MLYLYWKQFLLRLITRSIFLFFVLHYTWLCYYQTNSVTSQDYVSMQIPAFPRCKRPVFILIVVFSAPTNFEHRSIIRSTWAEIIDKDPAAMRPMSYMTNITEGSYSYTGQSLVKTIFLLGLRLMRKPKVL